MSYYKRDPNNTFDTAVGLAEEELKQLLQENPDMTARELMAFHAKWYNGNNPHDARAGHRNLGQMYVSMINGNA
jgi:hypothetical protein